MIQDAHPEEIHDERCFDRSSPSASHRSVVPPMRHNFPPTLAAGMPAAAARQEPSLSTSLVSYARPSRRVNSGAFARAHVAGGHEHALRDNSLFDQMMRLAEMAAHLLKAVDKARVQMLKVYDEHCEGVLKVARTGDLFVSKAQRGSALNRTLTKFKRLTSARVHPQSDAMAQLVGATTRRRSATRRVSIASVVRAKPGRRCRCRSAAAVLRPDP